MLKTQLTSAAAVASISSVFFTSPPPRHVLSILSRHVLSETLECLRNYALGLELIALVRWPVNRNEVRRETTLPINARAKLLHDCHFSQLRRYRLKFPAVRAISWLCGITLQPLILTASKCECTELSPYFRVLNRFLDKFSWKTAWNARARFLTMYLSWNPRLWHIAFPLWRNARGLFVFLFIVTCHPLNFLFRHNYLLPFLWCHIEADQYSLTRLPVVIKRESFFNESNWWSQGPNIWTRTFGLESTLMLLTGPPREILPGGTNTDTEPLYFLGTRRNLLFV